MPAKLTYEDYLALAAKCGVEFLHQEDELPFNVDTNALWRDIQSGQTFRRTYHIMQDQFRNGEPTSPQERFRKEYLPDFYKLAEKLGIEFIYDPTVDVCPASTKDYCKWRGRNGNVVIASYHQLAYQDIPAKVKAELGLDDRVAIPEEV